MSRLLRLGLVFLFLLLPLVGFAMGGWAGNVNPKFDVSLLPGVLAGSIEDELDPDVLKVIQPAEYVMRHVVDSEGLPATVYVAFYTGFDTTGAHDPTVCFPSQGWDLARAGYRPVPLANDELLTAEFFRATQGRDEMLVLYWFQPAARWTRDYPEELFFRVFDAIAGRKQYAFVQVTTPLDPDSDEGDEAAEERLVELAGELAPWARGILEGESPGTVLAGRP